MEIINTVDRGIQLLKEKNVRGAVETFGEAMALTGKNLEEEVKWVGERGLELILNVRLGVFTATWFYFSLHLGTQENERLNYLSQAQGLLSFDTLIVKPVVARVFKDLQEKGKIPSRNLAIIMIALDKGANELEKLITESLKNYLVISEASSEEQGRHSNQSDMDKTSDYREPMDGRE
ncbi:MAG: hypothetical protein EU536_02085 [Promethearchaeota archaeon]|nr:MAG: hypothetical protein EU536_02085 [Candidatus Lokiarchaeota archaeon]